MSRSFIWRGCSLVVVILFAMKAAACSGQAQQATPAENMPATSVEDPPATIEQETAEEPSPEPQSQVVEEVVEPQEPTAIPIQEATEIPKPTVPAPTVIVNGMPTDQFIIMPEETVDNIRRIYAAGEGLGRNPEVFSILGDSLIATPQSLAKWDGDDFNLGEYAFLQPTIDQYKGSFGRYGASVRVGLHSWSVFDPLWADKEYCDANEDVLTCEIRLNNPSVMIIFLGSNDAGSPGGFNVNYRQLVEILIEQGIVPVLATKADRFEGGDNVNNGIIRQIAVDFQVPLMEFDLLADTLPGRGLSSDNVHLTYLEPLDYSSSEIFSVGYPVHNLASLLTLDAVRRAASGEVEN